MLRLAPASLYPRERDSVLVPLPLLPLPERVEHAGETWRRKVELHVTAAHAPVLAARVAAARGIGAEEAEDAAWEAIFNAVAGRGAGPVTLRDELRVVRDGGERTIVAMAEVEGLAELHEALGAALGLEPEPPPAHVTLYTRPGGDAIGLHTQDDLDRLTTPLDARPFPWPVGFPALPPD